MIRVFISHNSRDAVAAKQLAAKLAPRQIECVLDTDQQPHVGGVTSWIEQMMSESDAIIVAIGPFGLGGWQRAEIDVAIAMQIDHGKRVVNVLLPGAPESPDLPALLKRYPWENFTRGFEEDALNRLAFVITGKRPKTAVEKRSYSAYDSLQREGNGAAAGPQVTEAVAYLVDNLLKGKNVTFFVGNRHESLDAGMPPEAWDLSRRLLLDLGLLAEGEDRKLLPSLDNVGAYYAYQRGVDGLEGRIRAQGSIGEATPEFHRALVQFLKRLVDERASLGASAGVAGSAQRPQLVVTTRLDLSLERALLAEGVAFTRIVQGRDGSRIESSYSDVKRLPGGGVRASVGNGRTRTEVSAGSAAEIDALISRPGALSRAKPGATLSLARVESIVLYKYHGSHDIENSCAITTDHLFDTARGVRVPQPLTEIMMNTPSVFVGCGIMDTDFRHLYHAVLSELFDRKIAPYERFALQRTPSLEPEDHSRVPEANMWDSIKRRALAVLGISILEERPEVFLEQLRSTLQSAAQHVA